MATPMVVGLAAGAGALGGLVVGGFAGTKLAGSTQTPDQQTAAVALGAAVGMFVGAFALGALVAEPGPAGSAPAGTAGIPKGLGAIVSHCPPGYYLANGQCVPVPVPQQPPWSGPVVPPRHPPKGGSVLRGAGGINAQLAPAPARV
jgi:hypothetical protein